MNKKFRKGFVFGLALVFVAAVVMAAIPTHYVTSLFVKNINRLSENHAVQLFNSDTAVVAKGFTISGSINATGSSVSNFVSTPPIVNIDDLSDLSTWSGAASGSSYFQTEAGKTYIVDPQAIFDSVKTAGTGVTEVQGWSGVTAHLPLATATNSNQTVTIMWATTGSLAGGSGSTTVQVWPAPLAGATMFRGSGAIGSQNSSGQATSGSSVVAVGVVGSYNIDAYGETGTWMLFYNSAVSAQMVDRDLP